jgi:hypothetical protein
LGDRQARPALSGAVSVEDVAQMQHRALALVVARLRVRLPDAFRAGGRW